MATSTVLNVARAPSVTGDLNRRLLVGRTENLCHFDSKVPRSELFNVARAPSVTGDFNRLPVGRPENLCHFDSKVPRSELFGVRTTSVFRLEKRRVHPRSHSVPRNAVPAKEADVVIPQRCVSVILLAGGKGTRMGANMPKQYLPLLGRPVALYSFQTFANMEEVEEIVVVCDPAYRDLFKDAQVKVTLKFALPGKERQDSVWSGLQQISKASKLACIHDCARPLVETNDIRKVLRDAWTTGAAVLGVPCKATIKEAGKGRFVSRTLDRSTLWEMQTPQVIEPQLLHRGYELVEQEGYAVTDDVSIVEYLKHPVLITEGSYTNLKITTRDDLMVAERILQSAVVVNSGA